MKPTEPTWAEVEAFVQAHPDGAQLEQIAEVFGLGRERVRQIEERALQKISRLVHDGTIVRGIVARREEQERRVQRVLAIIDEGPATLAEISNRTGLELRSVQTALQALRRQGRIRRASRVQDDARSVLWEAA